jgi:GxxExxY protein
VPLGWKAFLNSPFEDGARAPIPDSIEEVGASVVDAGMKVHKALGPGLLESAYEQCLAYELTERGLSVRRQIPLSITYGRLKIDAAYRVDMLIGEAVIVEVKSLDALVPVHQAQVVTYLKLSGHRLGFLMNFNVPLFKQGLKRIAR